MKKTTKVLALLATALMAFAVVGCKNPGSDPNPKPENNPVVIFESEAGWSEDWNPKSISAEQIANVTDGSAIYMDVSKDTDRLVKGTAEAPDYSECYCVIQLLKYDGSNGKFGEGTATGANITATPQLEGMFQDSDPNTKFYTISYKPTAAEWTNMKTNGFGIQAHGTMFKKIEIK